MSFDQADTTCKQGPTGPPWDEGVEKKKKKTSPCDRDTNNAPVVGTLATPCTWCVVESACGVICACLPTLRPLAKRISSKFSNSTQKSKSNTQSRGATELMTIGGTTAQTQSRSMTKSPFQRLDDESHVGYETKEAVHARYNGQAPSIVISSTEYASSGDEHSLEGDGARRVRTDSHGQEQHGKGFV